MAERALRCSFPDCFSEASCIIKTGDSEAALAVDQPMPICPTHAQRISLYYEFVDIARIRPLPLEAFKNGQR